MDAKRILGFLTELMANNNRQWFLGHKAEYEAVRADFEEGVSQAIARDTRFSKDKSPYKNHLGAYIAAHGKKALHGGYYIHLEPGHCLLSCGNYWLPTNVLTACRNEIMANTGEWLKCVKAGLWVGEAEDLSFGFPP